MFTLSSSQIESINDSMYKSLNSMSLSESDVVEFVDGTEANTRSPASIRGVVRITSAVLSGSAASSICEALGIDASTAIRIEIEPAISVSNVEESSTGDWQLIDTNSIDYSITSSTTKLCILNKSDDDEEGYNVDDWERHELEAPFVHEGIVGYLDSCLFDDITEPLVKEFLDYHNY